MKTKEVKSNLNDGNNGDKIVKSPINENDRKKIIETLKNYSLQNAPSHKERAASLIKAVSKLKKQADLIKLLLDQKALLEGDNPYPQEQNISTHQQNVVDTSREDFYSIIKNLSKDLRENPYDYSLSEN